MKAAASILGLFRFHPGEHAIRLRMWRRIVSGRQTVKQVTLPSRLVPLPSQLLKLFLHIRKGGSLGCYLTRLGVQAILIRLPHRHCDFVFVAPPSRT
jgi:hypothetical protein